MANLKGYYYLYVVFILAIAMNHTAMAREPSSRAVKGAYWPSYTGFPASAINTSLFTHLYYAFLVPNNVSLWFDISNSTALTLWNFTSTVSGKNPLAKTLVSIGGAGADLDTFSQMASKKSWRESFIDSSIEVARKYGFDGIDLDWEFPQNSTDMENLGYLLYEWRAAVQEEAKTTAVVRSYPVDSINRNLDWVNALTYDYHGSWDTNATGTLAGFVHYSYSGTSWITYDDVKSTTVKIAYVEALGLRGYFFWAVNDDLDWKIPRI
ncbi:hypothetical protein C3L33_05460, partial [Rhododendron williamsianum]